MAWTDITNPTTTWTPASSSGDERKWYFDQNDLAFDDALACFDDASGLDPVSVYAEATEPSTIWTEV
jgi:hypothetical protein